MTYKCPRCGYSAVQKGDIKKHFKRKNICSPSCSDMSIDECYKEVLGEEYENKKKCQQLSTPVSTSVNTLSTPMSTSVNTLSTPVSTSVNTLSTLCQHMSTHVNTDVISCKYCDRAFNKRQSKSRHEKTCKYKNDYSKQEFNEKIAEVNAASKDALLEEKDKIIAELKNQIEVLLTKVGNTTNNNTINININAFGKENMEYIKGGFIKELIARGPYSAIPKLLKEIHFNPDHSENHNVMIPNRKESYAKRYNGEKWELADKSLTLEDMSDKAFNVLTEYGSGKKFDRFYDDYDDRDTGLLKKMKRDTEMMILNNQEE